MNNASQGQSAGMSKAKRSISWHPFSPWQNPSELGSAHGLSKALLQVVKVVQVVFHIQQGPQLAVLSIKSPPLSVKKVSISRGNLPKKGTFPRLIELFLYLCIRFVFGLHYCYIPGNKERIRYVNRKRICNSNTPRTDDF